MYTHDHKTAPLAAPAFAAPTKESKAASIPGPGEQVQNAQPKSQEAIRLHAFWKWQLAGKPDGDAVKFWLEAEQELSRPPEAYQGNVVVLAASGGELLDDCDDPVTERLRRVILPLHGGINPFCP